MSSILPKSISRLILGVTILSILFTGAKAVNAQDISIVVSPPRTDFNIKPGETLQKTIKITNTSPTELILGAQVIDFIVTDDTGTPIKVTEEASGRFLASPWFTLDQTELVIPPKETAQITALITAPSNALPGGHYAGIYFEPKERRGEKKTISYTNAQVGSLFALTVAGDLNYDAVIKDFSTKNNLNEFGPIDFSLTLENQSDTHISPESNIKIYDMFGRELETLKLDQLNIFPFTERSLTSKWNRVWGLGQYRATATVLYGPGLTTSRDLTYWILPYRLIAAVVIIFLVLLASLISIRRHITHRLDSRDETIDELKRKIAEMENNQRRSWYTKIMPYFLVLLALLLVNFCTTNPVLASTDPLSATVSATATVPSTTATTSDTIAPPAVILISPQDGATTNQTRPEFVWKQTQDSNSNFVLYTLKLNNVATFLGISNTGNTQQHNYISRLSEGYIYLTPTIDLAEGPYHWSVEAYDASNNTSYSATWHLTIDTTPPQLTLKNIDDVYQEPLFSEGTIFDLFGPQEVTLTFVTEPWATVSLKATLPDDSTISLSLPTNETGIALATLELPLGLSQIVVTSFDKAGLTTLYPTFLLNLEPLTFAGLSNLSRLPPIATITNNLTIISSLPATISQIQSTTYISLIGYLLLAIAILALIVLIWKRRYNILILDCNTQKPFRSLIVYHSCPTHTAHFKQSVGRLFITNRDPVLYEVNSSGRLYIRHLGRYSSLTIRTPDGNTHILSLSMRQVRYVLAI